MKIKCTLKQFCDKVLVVIWSYFGCKVVALQRCHNVSGSLQNYVATIQIYNVVTTKKLRCDNVVTK